MLPGQLPDSPRGAARVHIVEPDKKKGVPLLEDTLSDRNGSRTRLAAGALMVGPLKRPAEAASPLDVPPELCSGSASFDADYRDGEQVTCSASISGSNSGGNRPSSGERGAITPTRDPHACDADFLRQRLDAPLRRAVSRASGQWRLYRAYPQAPCPPAVAEADGQAPRSHSLVSEVGLIAAPSGHSALRERDRPSVDTLPVSRELQHLQRELRLATELPRCPQLLLPHRVYRQPSAVHVLYDAVGEYSELFAVVRERQRLPERQCRSVLRQVLQALAVLHGELWAHRNISMEAVWVAELPQEPAQPPAQSSDLPPRSRESGPGAGAGAAAASDPACLATAVAVISTAGQGQAGASQGLGVAAAAERPAAIAARFSPGEVGGQQAGAPAAADGASARREDGRPSPHAGAPMAGKSSRRRGCAQRLVVKLGGLHLAARDGPEAASSGEPPPFRQVVGCPYHLAPEVVRGTGYGRSADIWAAGVLLFMLLTGRPPFPGENELEVMTRVLLVAAETEITQQLAAAAAAAATGAGAPESGPAPTTASAPAAAAARAAAGAPGSSPPSMPAILTSRTASMYGGPSSRSIGAASSVGTDGCPRPRRKLADSAEELVLQAALESCASAACREALAGMLEVDPGRRLSAEALLRLPWFAACDE